MISLQVTAAETVVPRHPWTFRFCPVKYKLFIFVLGDKWVIIGLLKSLIIPYALPCGIEL